MRVESGRGQTARRLARWAVPPIAMASAVAIGIALPAGAATQTGTAANTVTFPTAIGTWNQIVDIPGQGNEQTSVSLHVDGTVSAIAPPIQLPCPADPSSSCTLGSPSLGIWKPTGTKTFRYTIRENLYDSNNNVVNFVEPDVSATLSSDGLTYTGTANTGFYTTGGQLLFTVSATDTGTRMQFP